MLQYRAGSKHGKISSHVGSGGTALQEGPHEAKGLLYLLPHNTYLNWHNIDILMTGLCLPLDPSIKCLSFLCETVEGIELFINMVYLINSCLDFSVIILAKLGKHYF